MLMLHWFITCSKACMPCYQHNDSNIIPDVKLCLKVMPFLQKPKMVYLQTSTNINSSINGLLNIYYVIKSQIMKIWCPLLSLYEPRKSWIFKCWSYTSPSFCSQMIYQRIMLSHQKNINRRSVGGKLQTEQLYIVTIKILSFFCTGHLNSHTWPVISNGIITKGCGHHWIKLWPVAWWW